VKLRKVADNSYMKVSVAEEKNKLTQLIQSVEKGERVTICRHGQPVVDIAPTSHAAQEPRKFGLLKDVVLDPEWSRSQNDVDAWLKSDF
jgi:prevent-host-death family protein